MTYKYLSAFCLSLSLATSSVLADCIESLQWGAEDTLGSANLVTPQRTLEAAKLIKQGKSMPLGIAIGPNTPAFPPRSLNLQIVQPNQQGGQKLTDFGYEANYNDDIIQTWVGIGSQLDGLGHLGENGKSYNCLDEKEISAITGLTKLGTHAVPPLVGRAVILDMRHTLALRSWRRVSTSALPKSKRPQKPKVLKWARGISSCFIPDGPKVS